MKITKGRFYETYSVNILFSRYEQGMISAHEWVISIELSSEKISDLDAVTVQGLDIKSWISRLLGQKVFIEKQNDAFDDLVQNKLYINKFDPAYIAELIRVILEPNMPPTVVIESVGISI